MPSNSDVLKQIYLRDYRKLRSMSRGVQNCGDQDDVLQDIWLRIDDAASLDQANIREPRAYLFRMVFNGVAGYFRKDKRTGALAEELKLIETREDFISPERALAGKQALTAVRNALEACPERTRQIFLLSRIGGYTYREIAEDLSISEQTVHYHVRRAVDHLAPLRDLIYERKDEPYG